MLALILQVAAIIFLLLLLLITAYWYLTIPANLPPGPIGLPIFGSTFDTSDVSVLPAKLVEWTKIYGRVYKMYIAERLVLILGDYEALQEALVKQGETYAGRPLDHEFISKDAQKNLGFKTPNDDIVWKEERRFLISTLRDLGAGRSILEPKVKREVEFLYEQIDQHQGRPFDPIEFLTNSTANVMSELIFGKRYDNYEEEYFSALKLMRDISDDTRTSMLSPFILSKYVTPLLAKFPEMKKIEADTLTIVRYIQREIAQEKLKFDASNYAEYEPTNYVQKFFKAQENAGPNSIFTYDQLVVSVFNTVIAGSITTAGDLRWILFYMARYPEWQEKVYREIREHTGSSMLPSYADRIKLPLVEATILEVQRLVDGSPLGNPRKTLAKSKLFGYDIPKGTVVVSLLTSAMKDPTVFPNPNKFDPRRFLKSEATNLEEYKRRLSYCMPFQLGKRVCSGESLARMELFLFFTGLITRYQFSYSPDEPMPSEKGIEVTFGRVSAPFKICAKARKD